MRAQIFLFLFFILFPRSNVFVWNAHTTEIAYQLPGHKGSVNDVHFHPTEPIVLSGSSDKKLYLGELAM